MVTFPHNRRAAVSPSSGSCPTQITVEADCSDDKSAMIRSGVEPGVMFGIDESEPLTLKQIGQRIGLTRERVRQIEHEALRKLNELLADEGVVR